MRDIEISKELPFPRELVWRALTNPDELAVWLMKNDFAPVVGHEFTFVTDPAPGFDGIVHCKVLVVEPMQRLEMSWRGGQLDTFLKYTLSDTPNGTLLRLQHSGFKGWSNVIPRLFLGSGWKSLIGKSLGAAISHRRQNLSAST